MKTMEEATTAVAAHSFYISSPYLGLQKEREQAKQLITRRYHAYRDSYGGSTEPVVETCQGDVRRSDHYILILGERYGSRRPEHGGRSVTELEFEAAIECGRSLHAFFLNFVSDNRNGIERDPEAIQALEAFRERVRKRCIPLACEDKPVGRTGWEVLVEGITSLAASPPPRPGDTETPSMGRSYTPADLDVLFFPGGTTGTMDVMRSERTMAWVRDRASRAKHITSVCTGSMILGKAGLLKGT